MIALFIQELFMRMFEGDTIAWLAFSLIIIAVSLCSLFVIVWWKMPQPAKKLFLNNLVGHRPIIADAYDNKFVKFETPHIFREGILYDKEGGWHFVPRLTRDADESLNKAEQDIVTSAFNIGGASGQFYLAYSGKATIVNPELQAVIEQSGVKKKKGNPDGSTYINKNVLISALQMLKDDLVQIKPVWNTQFVDPRKIKNYLSKAYSKSQLLAQEIEIMESVREQYQGKIIKLLLFLNVGCLIGIGAMAAKLFGVL